MRRYKFYFVCPLSVYKTIKTIDIWFLPSIKIFNIKMTGGRHQTLYIPQNRKFISFLGNISENTTMMFGNKTENFQFYFQK